MRDIEQYYRILELEPGASLEEVHQSYRDMVLVWHPDRFQAHPRLQRKALAKIKEINEAREQLRSAPPPSRNVAVTTSSTAAPPPPSHHSQPQATDRYQQTVNPNRRREYQRSRSDPRPFFCQNLYDSAWLD